MDVVAFEVEVFEDIHQMRLYLHNKERSLTFDEQRDYADGLMLLLDKGVRITLTKEN